MSEKKDCGAAQPSACALMLLRFGGLEAMARRRREVPV
jgi:hypothetical protein